MQTEAKNVIEYRNVLMMIFKYLLCFLSFKDIQKIRKNIQSTNQEWLDNETFLSVSYTSYNKWLPPETVFLVAGRKIYKNFLLFYNQIRRPLFCHSKVPRFVENRKFSHHHVCFRGQMFDVLSFSFSSFLFTILPKFMENDTSNKNRKYVG